MFKCGECGAVFLEPKIWEESRGEYWGTPCYETVCGCPECGDHFEEAFECEECGEWFFKDELDDGICEECLNKKGENDGSVI